MNIAAIAVFLALYALVNFYVGARALNYLKILMPMLNGKLFWFIFIFLCLSTFLSFALSSTPLAKTMKLISNYWMGVFLYLLLTIAVIDIFRGIASVTGLLSPTFLASRGFLRSSALVVLIFSVLLIVYGVYNARAIRITDYKLSIHKEAKEQQLNLVMISDLHLGHGIGENRVKEIVTDINKLEPDVVAIAGDVFDNDYTAVDNIDNIIASLKSIKSTYGVYAVLGNHDVDFSIRQSGSAVPSPEDRIGSFFKKSGIALLKDEYVLINDSFYIAGRLDAAPIGNRTLERQELKAMLEGIDKTKPIILLDHRPTAIKEAEDNGADLLLSGHTHKGQVFPGNLITKAMYQVDYGYLHKGSLQTIVSSGVGFWGPPLRVGSHSEIVNIKISFKNEK